METFDFKGDRNKLLIYELLKTWNQLLTNYEKRIRDDLPYFYIERTNIGLLSSAAIKMGALTLEEYSAEKGREARKRQGRADLWIEYKGYTFDIEAKQAWIALDSTRIRQKVVSLLKDAVKDSKKLTEKGDRSVGIGFLVPYLALSKKADFEHFQERVLDIASYDGDFAAVHFSDEKIWGRKSLVFDNAFYPGIAVIGRYVKN